MILVLERIPWIILTLDGFILKYLEILFIISLFAFPLIGTERIERSISPLVSSTINLSVESNLTLTK